MDPAFYNALASSFAFPSASKGQNSDFKGHVLISGDASSTSPKFDSVDRLRLENDWFLIRGDNAFFMEYSGIGPDVQAGTISLLLYGPSLT